MERQFKWIVALTVVVIGVTLLAGENQSGQFALVPKIVFSTNNSTPRALSSTLLLNFF